MKTVRTILAATLLLLPWCSVTLFSQSAGSTSVGKRVVITKRTVDADGTETIETIVRKGQAAENFDVEQYIRDNQGEHVELDVRVFDDNADAEKVIVRRRETGEMEWVQDLEDRIDHALDAMEPADDRAFLGVEEDSDEDADAPGLVVDVVRGSAAEKAGLRSNDVLLQLNGTAVNDWDDLTGILRAAKPGDILAIEYSRDGKTANVQAQLTTRHGVQCDPASFEKGFLGIRPADKADEDAPGVAIEVVKGSGAEKAGLQDGDVLLGLNDTAIDDWEDVTDFMNYTKPGETVQVKYNRNGQKNAVSATLGKPEATNWQMNFQPADFNFDIQVREKEACLGVYTSAHGEGSARGARISEFTKESAAREAEMTAGDVITSVNGVRITGHDQLWNEIARYKTGDQVAVEFLRDNQARQIQATLKACRDNSNRVMMIEKDDSGERSAREFLLWNWVEKDQEQLRDQQVITIHRGAEGDAAQVNTNLDNNLPPDRRLQLENFRAYPNPAQSQVTVEFKAQPLPTVVSLLDISGRQLFREELNAFSGDYFQQFDLSEYAKGAVVLHVQQAGKVFTEQIIVN